MRVWEQNKRVFVKQVLIIYPNYWFNLFLVLDLLGYAVESFEWWNI